MTYSQFMKGIFLLSKLLLALYFKDSADIGKAMANIEWEAK
jgi:hypothetical protein